MATINLKFNNKPNDSLQPGDIAFYTSTSVSNSFTVNSGISKKLGVVRSIKHVSEVYANEVASADNLIVSTGVLGPELILNGTFSEDVYGNSSVIPAVSGFTAATGWNRRTAEKHVAWDSFVNGTAANTFISQQLTLDPDCIYSVKIKIIDGGPEFGSGETLSFGIINNDLSVPSTSPSPFVTVSGPTSGVKEVLVKPNNASHSTFAVRNNENSGGYWLDDFSVKKITPDYWIVNVDIPDNTASPAADDYIFFSKSTQANFSGIAGYYGEITFTNNKTSAAELYSINSEVFESSK